MEVILLSDVDKVGLRGEVVNVARGYARNYLLPRKLAETATPGRVAELKRLDDQRARHEARSVEQANEIADVLRKTVLSFDVKAGPTGALFGSVTTTDIADELWRTRKIRVDRKKIDTDSIRRIGRYAIPIQIFEDVTVDVKTLVVPEGGELPPEEELAAMEAAEAEAEAAKEAEAEAHRAEAAEALEAEIAAEEEAAEAEPRRGAGRVGRRARRGRRGDGRRRARGRRDRARVGVPQRAPQACGARCELPALSGHGVCGQVWAGLWIFVENRENTRSLRPAKAAFSASTVRCGSPAVEAVRRCRSNGQPWLRSRPATLRPCPRRGPQLPHVPSHDLDAEMSVLSAMLLAPTAIAAVSEHLKASDFYRRTHGVIFDVARGLFERGEPVDAITVTAKLEEEGQLELVGGRGKIHEIAAWASAAGNAAHYALIVRDHSLIRAALRRGPRDHAPRRRARRRDDPPDLEGRAGAVRGQPGGHPGRAALAQGGARRDLRAGQPPLRDGRVRHRHLERLRRARRDHGRFPAREPDHPGRPPLDGQERPRDQHRRQRRPHRHARAPSSRSRCRSRR